MELAARFGVHQATVTFHLNRAQVERHKRRRERVRDDEAITLYQAGWSLARLAARYDVSAGTIRILLLQAGEKTRPREGRR